MDSGHRNKIFRRFFECDLWKPSVFHNATSRGHEWKQQTSSRGNVGVRGCGGRGRGKKEGENRELWAVYGSCVHYRRLRRSPPPLTSVHSTVTAETVFSASAAQPWLSFSFPEFSTCATATQKQEIKYPRDLRIRLRSGSSCWKTCPPNTRWR